MKYVDPNGERLILTGSFDEIVTTLQGIKDMIGEKAFSNNLVLTKVDGGYEVTYDDGELSVGGEIGVALDTLIDSSKSVFLRTSFERKTTGSLSSKVRDLEFRNGGITTLTGKNNIDIIVASGAGEIGTARFKIDGVKGPDGNLLTSTYTIALAHEIGHAFGLIGGLGGDRENLGARFDRGEVNEMQVESESNRYSLMFENVERQRLGLSRRDSH